jgi:hypothetical protein
MTAQDVAFQLKIHAEGEIWLWKEYGAAFSIQHKSVELLVRVSELWNNRYSSDLACILAQLGWRYIARPDALWIRRLDFQRYLNDAYHDAKVNKLAVVDYGSELVSRVARDYQPLRSDLIRRLPCQSTCLMRKAARS